MKFVFINRFFYPDQSATSVMLTDLICGLDNSSNECVVITSASSHTPGKDIDSRDLENVTVLKVPGLRQDNPGYLTRLCNFALFYLGLLFVGLRSVKRGDVVVCLTDPPLLSIAAQIVAGLKRAKVVNWLQDIYPEVATTLGVVSERNPALRLMEAARNWSWRRAHVNVCIGERMRSRVRTTCGPDVPLRVIPNWADERALSPLPVAGNPLRGEWGLPDDAIIVGYSGNLGRAHDVDTMVDAGRQLIADGEQHLQFLFVGGGVKQDLLPCANMEPHIGPHFKIRGYRPRGELQRSLAVADIHWLSLEPDLEGLIVPSKFYGAIAAGRPLIFIGDTKGEIARLIEEADCGRSFAKGEVHDLADYLRSLSHDADLRDRLGTNARRYCELHLRKSERIADWGRLLGEVARSDRRGLQFPEAKATSHRTG